MHCVDTPLATYPTATDNEWRPLCDNLPDDILQNSLVPCLTFTVLFRLATTSHTMRSPSALTSHRTDLNCFGDLNGRSRSLMAHTRKLQKLTAPVDEWVHPLCPDGLRSLTLIGLSGVRNCVPWFQLTGLRRLIVNVFRDQHRVRADAQIERSNFFQALKLPLLEYLELRIAFTAEDRAIELQRTQLPNLKIVHADARTLIYLVARMCDPLGLTQWRVPPTKEKESHWKQLQKAGYAYENASTESLIYTIPPNEAPVGKMRRPYHRMLAALTIANVSADPEAHALVPIDESRCTSLLGSLDPWVRTRVPTWFHDKGSRLLRAATEDFDSLCKYHFWVVDIHIGMNTLARTEEYRSLIWTSSAFWTAVFVEPPPITSTNGPHRLQTLLRALSECNYDFARCPGLVAVLNSVPQEGTITTCTPHLHECGMHHWCGCYAIITGTRLGDIQCNVSV